MLRTADIDQVSLRFEAMLLYSDDAERSRKLSPEELAKHKTLIHEGAAQTAAALYAKDMTSFVEDCVAFASDEGLRINPRWSHFERFALGMIVGSGACLSGIRSTHCRNTCTDSSASPTFAN